MTLNADKCHLLVSGCKHKLFVSASDETIWEENAVKLLLGILIDSDLIFTNHIKMICKKASQKLTGIARM